MRKWLNLVSAIIMVVSLSAGVVAQETGDPAATRPFRAGSQPDSAGSLTIYNVWVRPTAARPIEDMDEMATPETSGDGMSGMAMPSRPVTGGYMIISNTTPNAYTLVGVSAAFSGMGEIHESSMSGEMMQMRPLEDGLAIPPQSEVELAPGGFHVMLMGVETALYPDEAVALTLVFANEDGSTFERTVGALVTDFPPEPGLLIAADGFAMPAPVSAAPLNADSTPMPALAENRLALVLTLINAQLPTVNVIGGRLDFGGTVEVRESYLDNGQLANRAIPFVPVPVGAQLTFQPNGYFLQVADVETMPETGEAFLGTVIFDDGTEIVVPFVMR